MLRRTLLPTALVALAATLSAQDLLVRAKTVVIAPDTVLADGRFLMEDPGQTMRIELDVFGSANAAILARLWRAGHALDARAAG